jgi:hypothetical protein
MNKYTKHTPGPWAANDDGLVLGNMDNYEGEAPLVCTCGSADDLNKEPELHLANARLIAAAPDLLKTCRFLLKRAEQLSAGTKAIDGLIPDARMDLELDIEDASKLIDRIEGGAE